MDVNIESFSDSGHDDACSVVSLSSTWSSLSSKSSEHDDEKPVKKRGRPLVRKKDKDRSTAKKTADPTSDFKFRSSYTEDHRKEIFSVKFADQLPVFATTGANRISVYKCIDDGRIEFMQCYQDPNPDELFYTCAWTVDRTAKRALLAAGGENGILRIICIHDDGYSKHFPAHSQAINEIKFHPKMSHLLLSASADYSVRLWNIRTNVCVAIFCGIDGHRDEVLSIDFDLNGDRFASSGMDKLVLVYHLTKANIQAAIADSDTYDTAKSQMQFNTLQVITADYSSKTLHCNYVDSVAWYGDFIISKQCCANLMQCWTADKLKDPTVKRDAFNNMPLPPIEFDFDDSTELWFIRLSIDPMHKYLAVGQDNGDILVWNLDDQHDQNMEFRRFKLCHRSCRKPVRQVAFSPDSNILIAVCQDSTVWRWDCEDAA